jgi:hypothetical protein
MSASTVNTSNVREHSGKFKGIIDPESVVIILKRWFYVFSPACYISRHFTCYLFINFAVFIIFESTA